MSYFTQGESHEIVFYRFTSSSRHMRATDRGCEEHCALKRTGAARSSAPRYLWLRWPEDIAAEQRTTFRALQCVDLRVDRAWALDAIPQKPREADGMTRNLNW